MIKLSNLFSKSTTNLKLRYTLHRHHHPTRGTHLDMLFENPEKSSNLLLCIESFNAPTSNCIVDKIWNWHGEVRRFYLDYSGELRPELGHINKIESGFYSVLIGTEIIIEFTNNKSNKYIVDLNLVNMSLVFFNY